MKSNYLLVAQGRRFDCFLDAVVAAPGSCTVQIFSKWILAEENSVGACFSEVNYVHKL